MRSEAASCPGETGSAPDLKRPFQKTICPRLLVAGLSGGSGKTLFSLGLGRALVQRGVPVLPCKKGPDYIDAAWLSLAVGAPPLNLDSFFLEDEALLALFHERRAAMPEGTLALIEGNRGLYDGRDLAGSCSSARLARLLRAPVVLCLNCSKMTRTAAALVAGVTAFEPVPLAGVLLNRIGSSRHGEMVRRAIEEYTGVKVLGILPRLPRNPVPERHMGLVSLREEDPGRGQSAMAIVKDLAALVEEHCDVASILELACQAPPLPEPACPEASCSASPSHPSQPTHPAETGESASLSSTFSAPSASCARFRPRLGFVRDAALWFYYEENLTALRRAGADLVELSLLDPREWPWLDGLYLGGGFPEVLAPAISASPHLETIRTLSREGRPIYAECGGLMILCRDLAVPAGTAKPGAAAGQAKQRDETGKDGDGAAGAAVKIWSMAGLFPLPVTFCARPQGLGYVRARVLRENPFHPLGTVLRGHEFHYSRAAAEGQAMLFSLTPGAGLDGRGGDGLLLGQTLAAYMHIYAPAAPHWAPNFVAACSR